MGVTVLEQAKYIVWVDNGGEGWIPTACDTWEQVMDTVRNAYGGWLITRPVVIAEPTFTLNGVQLSGDVTLQLPDVVYREE